MGRSARVPGTLCCVGLAPKAATYSYRHWSLMSISRRRVCNAKSRYIDTALICRLGRLAMLLYLCPPYLPIMVVTICALFALCTYRIYTTGKETCKTMQQIVRTNINTVFTTCLLAVIICSAIVGSRHFTMHSHHGSQIGSHHVYHGIGSIGFGPPWDSSLFNYSSISLRGYDVGSDQSSYGQYLLGCYGGGDFSAGQHHSPYIFRRDVVGHSLGIPCIHGIGLFGSSCSDPYGWAAAGDGDEAAARLAGKVASWCLHSCIVQTRGRQRYLRFCSVHTPFNWNSLCLGVKYRSSRFPSFDATQSFQGYLAVAAAFPEQLRARGIRDWLYSTGIEHQPGPPPVFGMIGYTLLAALSTINNNLGFPNLNVSLSKTGAGTDTFIEIGNISHALNHAHTLAARECDAMFLQEMSAHKRDHYAIKDVFKEGKKHIHIGVTDPESKTLLGGMGAFASDPKRAIIIKPRTDIFRKAVDTGRCQHYALDIGCSTCVSFYNIYGWTGGHTCKKARRRTNGLCNAIRSEIGCHPPGPVFICGDVNADFDDIQCLKDLTQLDGWVDLGHNAHIWGQERDEATCLAPGAAVPTRRDYIFANPIAFPMVTNFKVHHQATYPVHSILQMYLKSSNIVKKITKVNSPISMYRTFLQKFNDDNVLTTAKEDTEAYKAEKKARHIAWESQLLKFHNTTREVFRANAPALQQYLQLTDTNALWNLWNKCIEDAFCCFCNIDAADQKFHRGHGHFRTKTHSIQGSGNVDSKSGTIEDPANKNLRRIRAQARRLSQWADTLFVIYRKRKQTQPHCHPQEFK